MTGSRLGACFRICLLPRHAPTRAPILGEPQAGIHRPSGLRRTYRDVLCACAAPADECSYTCSLSAFKRRSRMRPNGDALTAGMPVSATFRGFSPGTTTASGRAARRWTCWARMCGSNLTAMVGFGRSARLGDRGVVAEASSRQC